MRYLLFNKPYNVLSQFSPHRAAGPSQTLADYVTVKEVYPAGRLDRDSEGLLLLTDDGDLQNRLSTPAFAHPRTYWVQMEGVITAIALESLRAGVVVQGYRTLPALATALAEPLLPLRVPPIRFRQNIPTCWMELTIREGRNRQVRHMTAATGFPTLRLVRIAIGDLRLDGLAPGAWRDLNKQEVAGLRAATRKPQYRNP